VLNDKVHAGAKNLPLIRIDYRKIAIDIDWFDAIVFTSKNGVIALDRVCEGWQDKRCYSIGPATTKVLQGYGVEPCYTAKSSYGDDFAREITGALKEKRVLFPKAAVVYSSLVEILVEHGIDVVAYDIYETRCQKSTLSPPVTNAVIIFSSPSTVTCFFKQFTWHASYRAIAIGERTASFIPHYADCIVSEVQSIDYCIKLAEGLQGV
jgi:uroporphyrinogen-III synthase